MVYLSLFFLSLFTCSSFYFSLSDFAVLLILHFAPFLHYHIIPSLHQYFIQFIIFTTYSSPTITSLNSPVLHHSAVLPIHLPCTHSAYRLKGAEAWDRDREQHGHRDCSSRDCSLPFYPSLTTTLPWFEQVHPHVAPPFQLSKPQFLNFTFFSCQLHFVYFFFSTFFFRKS